MDRRISYKIVLDTETCPIDNTMEGVVPWNMLVYDCGWAVVDKRGKVYKKQSFVNSDIFIKELERMQSSYYAEKIPQYWEDIFNGDRVLTTFNLIKKALFADIAEYGVTEIYAHNARFDRGALNATENWINDFKWFFPKNILICDTLKMSRDVLGSMPTYIRFCENYGFTTKNGKPRFTAEILYRYISRNIDFEESHTGLEDVMIEKEIMAYCYKQHKKMRKYLD